MYDLDHMLNGKGSRNHLQDLIQQAQQAKFAREVKPLPATNKVIAPFPAILVAIINLVTR